jgi:3-deoxy-D-manno-octulosonic acid kinase
LPRISFNLNETACSMPETFPGYIFCEKNHRSGYVLTANAEAVSAALFEDMGCTVDAAAGRGQVSRFPLTEGEGVLRRYRRGGLVAHVSNDAFLGNRMLAEFRIHVALFQQGFPVPEPLGVVWERRGPLYRGAIATRSLEAITLLDHLNGGAANPQILAQCGQRIREMHELGVWHADLQVKNIMTDGDAVWLLDFDQARMGKPLSGLARARNLLRLRRSLEKHGRSLDNFDSILEGYGKLGLPRWLSGLYRIRGVVSDTLRK